MIIQRFIQEGYPPNSHDCLPNENIYGDIKDIMYKMLSRLDSKRRTVLSVHRLLPKAVSDYDQQMRLSEIAKSLCGNYRK